MRNNSVKIDLTKYLVSFNVASLAWFKHGWFKHGWFVTAVP